jgi:hypothetical protein
MGKYFFNLGKRDARKGFPIEHVQKLFGATDSAGAQNWIKGWNSYTEKNNGGTSKVRSTEGDESAS